MRERVKQFLERIEQVESLLSQKEIIADQKKYRQLAQEHSYLSEIRELWVRLVDFEKQLLDNQDLMKKETDTEFLAILRQDIDDLQAKIEGSNQALEDLLVPPDARDSCNIIMEVRAGTGGDEASLFVSDCVRMYKCYADQKGWKYDLLSSTPSELGGFKEYIMVLSGPNVFRLMQHEAGTHRVQRVPVTEAQGRVHTSAITVAILLEPTEGEKVELDERDLKIDTYRASGAGGQHVNTTDSAVRITHLPTGTVVYCQEERSQHKNKEKALRLLSAKIVEEKRRQEEEAISSLRSQQVGSGDRSERIRTYNFPQNRLTDHRIHLTLYKLDRVLEGDLDDLTTGLVRHFHQQKLASLSV
jgi:peptide chain release factor 1